MARLNNTPSPRKREYPRRALKLPSRLERGLSEGLFARATGENETTTTTKSSYLSSSASSREGVLGGKQPQSQGKKTRKGKNSDGADFPIFYDSDALFEREAEETDNDDDSDDDNENREGEEEEEEEGTSGSPASSSLFSSSRSSESSGASAHSHAPKATISKDPLKLTHVNSLLLSGSVFQQARNHRHRRAPRKSETIDYDKENDPVELPGDEEEERQTQREGDTVSHLTRNSSDASSRRVPGRRDSRQTVGRNNGLFSTYRRQQPREHDMEEEEDEEEGTSEDNGSDDDSLDDFIVSDNEEVSYHETSSVGGETEDEDEGKKIQRIPSSPHSPPKPRRRLMRGRRPAAKQESESEEEAKAEPEPEVKKSWKAPSNKEQLPIGDTIRCSTPGSRHSQMSQKGFNIAEELDHLNLDDNDASCQLVQDLNE